MTHPNYPVALEQLKANDLEGALQSLDLVLRDEPLNADAYYQRGRVRAKRHDLTGAIADYSTVINLQPTAESYLNRATLYLTQEPQSAIADGLKAIQLNPDLAVAHQILAKAYSQQGAVQEAIAAYKQAARCYLSQKEKENAHYCIRQIEQLQTLVPLSSPSPTAVSSTTLQQPVQHPVQQPVQQPVTTQQLLQKAIAHIERERYSEALTELHWILQFEPDHVAARCHRAHIYAQMGDTSGAIQEYARALKVAPERFTVLWHRGKTRLFIGDYRGAIADFTDLLQQGDPTSQLYALQDLYAHRGHGYRQLGELDKAFKDYSNALGMQPNVAELYVARAEVQNAMDELAGAIADYQQAATLWLNQGNSFEYQRILTRLETLQLTLQQQTQAKAAAEAKIIRVPIKARSGGSPVIEVMFNHRHVFDMVLDTGASRTLITQQMARILQVEPTGRVSGRMADGRIVELETGWVQAIAAQTAVLHNLQITIAAHANEGLLGQDFLSQYNVHITPHTIELHRRN